MSATRHGITFGFLCLVFFLAVVWLPAAVADFSVATLLRQAQARRLHEQRYWRILLHYRPLGGGWESFIDDPRFFLASRGKTDPEQELRATIQSLFGSEGAARREARCRFPARHAWLRDELGVSEPELPADQCPELAKVLERVSPERATLVYPGSYPNSPASMFGHTLLNFAGPRQSKPLAHAANYSAFTEESNGFAYAIKGLTGGYRGYFSLLPYYEKIKEYNGVERRDMWEYPLSLTARETRDMFLHLWELRDIYSDYFFFDENCSFNLLFLLEAARPSLRLTDTRPLWVLPIDTVRWVNRAGLITEAHYRPSLATLLEQGAATLSPEEAVLVRRLIRGELSGADLGAAGLERDAGIRVLEVAAQAVEMDFLGKRLDPETYRRRYLDLLTSRSSLGLREPAPASAPQPVRPDWGHGSSRWSLGIGRGQDRWVEELRYRPVYHSLLDDEAGYLPGSQIVLGELAVRVDSPRNHVRLEKFHLIDILSLAPVSAYAAPVSWQVKLGARQEILADGEPHLTGFFSPGAGIAVRRDWGLAYLMLETETLGSGSLKHGHAFGGGGAVGGFRSGVLGVSTGRFGRPIICLEIVTGARGRDSIRTCG